jgi:hypothetical protein
MIIEIDKNYLGNKNIKLNLSNDKLLYSTNSKHFNFNELLVIENIERLDNLFIKYNKLFKCINIDNTDNLDMTNILGRNIIDKHIDDVKRKIVQFKNRNLKYYNEFYWKRCALTKMISDTKYDHYSTVTGRSKILSGNNIIIMKKKDRNNIKSRFKQGRIIEIDIVSLEPRILSKFINLPYSEDVYLSTVQRLNLKSESRKKVKLGLLAIMYGAANETVKKLSGLSKENINEIRKYYKINELKFKLEEEYKENNLIRNMYDRPVNSNKSIINYFIQSSAADCAQIAFYDYLNKLDKNYFHLIGVIHDAIIIDAHPKLIDFFANTYMLKEDYLNINLPVKAKVLS